MFKIITFANDVRKCRKYSKKLSATYNAKA